MTYARTPWTGRAVLHVDMDAFFAAVEQLDHPEWKGLPVIVGGDPAGRGVVSAASYEARRFGVRSALPSARAALLCPEAVWVRPRLSRYQELAAVLRSLFAEETPKLQPTSIDEAYLDVTPGRYSASHPIDVASRIQQRVDDIGLSCSIGVATSKTVAKIASDRDKPHGMTVVPPSEEAEFLAPLPISVMPGIGRVTSAKLERFGISTLGELAALDDRSLAHVLGPSGPLLALRARGIDESPVAVEKAVKSVSNERTFAEDVHTTEEVRSALNTLTEKLSGRLRRKALTGRTVSIKVRYGDFTTRSVQRSALVPTDEHCVINDIAWELLATVWSPGVGIRLLGVGVTGFEIRSEQLDLFVVDSTDESVRKSLVKSIDAVRERFGPDALRYGHTGPVHRSSSEGSAESDTDDRRVT